MWGLEKGDGCPIFGRPWQPMTPPSAPSPKAFLNRISRSFNHDVGFQFRLIVPPGGGWIFEAWLRCPRVWYLEAARRNGVRLCWEATWRGIFGPTVRQRCSRASGGGCRLGPLSVSHYFGH